MAPSDRLIQLQAGDPVSIQVVREAPTGSEVQAVVLFDAISYKGKGADGSYQRLEARKGETIALAGSEYDRLKALSAVGTRAELEVMGAGPGTPTIPTSLPALRLMTMDQLAAYMANATDAEAERVGELMDELADEKRAEAEARANASSPTPPPTTNTEPPAETTSGASNVSDADLSKMSVDNLAVHLSQFPGDIDRADSLESQRSKRRTGVDTLLDDMRTARSEIGLEGSGDTDEDEATGDGPQTGTPANPQTSTS